MTPDFSNALLSWYDENRRILPWRESPTPYHVWLSEIMLQQTRVEAVLSYYERFLAALPDIPALAQAPEDLCLKLWEGLGYYSRVRNLQKGAQQIMTEYGGRMPETESNLLKIAGIGPYTAAAIASIAFGQPAPAIDGNLLRIFARLTEYPESIKDAAARSRARQFYAAEISPDRPGDFNQALMDLGSAVCLAHSTPHCSCCPLANLCRAQQNGTEAAFPIQPEKRARPVIHYTVFLIHDAEKIAIRKRPAKGLLAGLYEFPNAEGELDEAATIRHVRALGFSPLRLQPLPAARHLFTHREWQLSGYDVLTDELKLEESAGNVGGLSPADIRRGEVLPAKAPQDRLSDMKNPDEKNSSGILLVSLQAIRENYSIPSAFSAYKEYLLSRRQPGE